MPNEQTPLSQDTRSNNTEVLTDEQCQQIVKTVACAGCITISLVTIGFFLGAISTIDCIPTNVPHGSECCPSDVSCAQILNPCLPGLTFRNVSFSSIWGGFSLFGVGAGSICLTKGVENIQAEAARPARPTNYAPMEI